jgi:hypothetical protein
MSELNPWYVTGFCDGEAAFTYSRSGGTFGMVFSIKQRKDNSQIIEDIWEFFNHVGNIYDGKEVAPTKNSGHTKASVIYKVSRVDELLVIVDHFDRYPLQSIKKQEAFKVWREMVMHKSENYHRIDYDKLRALAEKLSSLNSKSRAFLIHRR